MRAYRCVRVATITTRTWLLLRASYKGARSPASSGFRLVQVHCTELCRFFSQALVSVSALFSSHLCRASVSSPLLLCSRLCIFLGSCLCSSLCHSLIALDSHRHVAKQIVRQKLFGLNSAFITQNTSSAIIDLKTYLLRFRLSCARI